MCMCVCMCVCVCMYVCVCVYVCVTHGICMHLPLNIQYSAMKCIKMSANYPITLLNQQYACTIHVLYMYCICTVYVLYMYYTCTVYVLYMYCTCTVYVQNKFFFSPCFCCSLYRFVHALSLLTL